MNVFIWYLTCAMLYFCWYSEKTLRRAINYPIGFIDSFPMINLASIKWQFINIELTAESEIERRFIHLNWRASICDQIDINIYFKPINCISLSSSALLLGYPIKWQWRRTFTFSIKCYLPRRICRCSKAKCFWDSMLEKKETHRHTQHERREKIMSFDAQSWNLHVASHFLNVWKWISCHSVAIQFASSAVCCCSLHLSRSPRCIHISFGSHYPAICFTLDFKFTSIFLFDT